ncbi:MAG TPA: HAD family hydrolase [Rectinemataceae bacterium]
MEILRIPPRPEALVFDLDNTLYTHPAYAAFQESSQIERLASWIGCRIGEAEARVRALKEARAAAGLQKTSSANLFRQLGVPMEEIVRWRVEAFRPSEWLDRNPALDEALGRLSGRYRLALLTNNPRAVGEASLEALGVRPRFAAVAGLDDSFESKPSVAPFAAILSALGMAAEVCISIGDRMDVDLAPAMELGMGAILVDGVEDVIALPGVLLG